MPRDEGGDERAFRYRVAAALAKVVEDRAGQLAAESLSLVLGEDLGVHEHDPVRAPSVGDETGEPTITIDHVPILHRVVAQVHVADVGAHQGHDSPLSEQVEEIRRADVIARTGGARLTACVTAMMPNLPRRRRPDPWANQVTWCSPRPTAPSSA